MLVTCSECDKKFKVDDGKAGKKVRCPECDHVIMVPAAASKRAAASEDDEKSTPADANAKPAAKAGMGMMLALGGGALVLLLLVGVVGAVGIGMFIWLRPKPDDVKPPEPTGPKVNIVSAKFERVSRQVELIVNYEASNISDGDQIGVYCVFPSEPNNPRVARVIDSKNVRDNPKGPWQCDAFTPTKLTMNDPTCDIVIRIARNVDDLPGGKEIGRMANVAVPAVEPLTVRLTNVTAKRRLGPGGQVDLSFDYTTTGTLPDTIWFDVEFVDSKTGQRRPVNFDSRSGQNIRPAERIARIINNVGSQYDTCNILVGDFQPPHGGNVTKLDNIAVQPGFVPADLAMSITNASVERVEFPPDSYNISIYVKALGNPPTDRNYQIALVYSIGGVKQPPKNIGFGTVNAETLRRGHEAKQFNMRIPPGVDPAVSFIVTESAGQTQIAELPNIPLTGAGKATLTGINVYKLDNNRVRLEVDVEFNNNIEANKIYTLMVDRFGQKGQGSSGIAWQGKGSDIKVNKFRIVQDITKGDIGSSANYQVWMAVGVTTADTTTVCSNDPNKLIKATDVPIIDIASVKLAPFPMNKGTAVEITYKLVQGAALNPKVRYQGYFQAKNGFQVKFLDANPGLMPAGGTFTSPVAHNLGNDTEIEAWIVEFPSMRVVSNKKLAEIKR